MLLVGAGLLIRSFAGLQKVSPGFDPEGVITMRLGPSARRIQNPDEAAAFYRPFNDALASVSGVTMRGAVSSLPFTSSVGWGSINAAPPLTTSGR
jgi:putative ABC transport system permease protein